MHVRDVYSLLFKSTSYTIPSFDLCRKGSDTYMRSLRFENVLTWLTAAIYLQLFCGIRESQCTERITTQLKLR